ncbi:MAG: polysaccharide deacetylase [Bryobacterales bacterium]|nr:polysaccharide deacetylase [Bryobacterales bacterium]
MTGGRLRVVFLIGRRNASTELSIAQVCRASGIEPVAVLIDTGKSGLRRLWLNLRRNIRREGIGYVFYRGVTALRQFLERCADRVIPAVEVETLLREAFPARDLRQLSGIHGFQIFEVGNLNGPTATERLRSLRADLGVVLGTRVLKRRVFEIPRLGCVNLHKGRVPEYRGMPPGFWELYDGASSAGVTVHLVDDGLDTGDVLGASDIPIHHKETPESLSAKLNLEGSQLLAEVVSQIQQGTAQRRPQTRSHHTPRTRPTRAQQLELAKRLPHWRRRSEIRQVCKLALWLIIFHTRLYSLLRMLRRGQSRGAILLYHRVNDLSDDVLTTSTRRFAEHLVTLRRYYRIMPTEKLVEQIAAGQAIKPAAVAIHFDDCYRDGRTHAGPLLQAAQAPAVSFVSSGFVDTDRAFDHDLEKYPHTFENFRAQELRELPELGMTVAAHTVNHVDLGKVDPEQAHMEVFESRRQLEQMTGAPVLLFSFPFGGFHNIRPEVRTMVVEAGYRALFSAHGGFIGDDTELFDIPRIGVSSEHSPLALMMELEGLSLANLRYQLRKRRPREGR